MIARYLWLLAAIASLVAAPRVLALDGAGLLWEASSRTTTVYLLGTIHVGTPAMYPLPAAMEAAYSRAQAIALEADPTDPSALLAAMGTVMYQPPATLEQNLSPALFRDVREALASAGLPAELAQGMKPYMVAMTLTLTEATQLGYDVGLGVDLHLATRARRDGKRIIELESMGSQLALLDAMSRETQVAMLESTVKALKSGTLKHDLAAMIDAWRAGDAQRLDEAATRDFRAMPGRSGRDLKDALLDTRNRAMATRIARMLEGTEVILTGVGAGHLTGDTGIVQLLRARGYAVRRVETPSGKP